MTDQPKAAQVAVRFELKDYVRLQLWMWWLAVPMYAAFFTAIAAAVAINAAMHEPSYAAAWHRFLYVSPLYIGIVVVGLAIGLIMSFFFAAIRWAFASTGREMSFGLDEAGVSYSASNVDVTVRWPNIRSYSETEAALFVRTKRVHVRIPKRALSAEMLGAFRDLFARHGVRRTSIWRVR